MITSEIFCQKMRHAKPYKNYAIEFLVTYSIVGSRVSQPQKDKVLKFFLIVGFVELFMLIILVKNISSITQLFFMLWLKSRQNPAKT